jgi:hypothetical protein
MPEDASQETSATATHLAVALLLEIQRFPATRTMVIQHLCHEYPVEVLREIQRAARELAEKAAGVTERQFERPKTRLYALPKPARQRGGAA